MHRLAETNLHFLFCNNKIMTIIIVKMLVASSTPETAPKLAM